MPVLAMDITLIGHRFLLFRPRRHGAALHNR